MTAQTQVASILEDVIRSALKKGADAAEAVFADGDSFSVSWRDGKVEELGQAEASDLGVRVFVGKRQASCSSSAMTPQALESLVERAVAMAKAAPEDPFCGLAAPDEIARDYPDLTLADEFDVEMPRLTSMAQEMEEAALAVPGVVLCESSRSEASRSRFFLAASNGFFGAANRTSYGFGVAALAGQGTAMEQDSESISALFLEDIPSPSEIGRKAGEKAVSHLGGRKMPTCKTPVVFDPQEASDLLGILVGAIKGTAIARETSFLKDRLGKQVFSKGVTIVDDPFRSRGLRSRAFDGEGLLPQKRLIVDDGVLQTWLLDLRSARQLGLKSTGHASRGISGAPSPVPTNFFMQPGGLSPQDLIADIKNGIYVTETMGMGVDGVTGDYSMAVRGFWIENGMRSFPVAEMTVAGNLTDMFLNLSAASDLAFRYGIDAPTLRIEGMTVAGA